MITRYALFEGTIAPGKSDAFEEAVTTRLIPLWRQFTGAVSVRVTFGRERDEGAPEFPLVLAITYADRAGLEAAMASPARAQSREVTGQITAKYFSGRIHHHVTEGADYPV